MPSSARKESFKKSTKEPVNYDAYAEYDHAA
jgi:hypothetical protein